MSPNFPSSLSMPIKNHLTGADYTLRRADEVEETQVRLNHLVSIGNEPKVYSWIFREIFNGLPYEEKNAKEFFAMGNEGWRKNEQFVFSLLDQDGNPAASIDIKTADLDYAEIGYLCSSAHRGVMTNTLLGLIDLAREAGFRKLFARTRKRNN